MFKIQFQISSADEKEITIVGGWPEVRPLPALGDFVYLHNTLLGDEIYRVQVQNIIPIYIDSIQKVSFEPDTEYPVFAKWVLVLADFAPLSKGEEKVSSHLKLVKFEKL